MDEVTADDETPKPGGPLRPRFGRLSLIFAAIVVGGLIVASVGNTSGGDSGSASVSTLDPRVVPLGALAAQPAPDVSFPLFDGATFSVAEHFATDGRPLVVNFWASWCIPCREEMPAFSELATENPQIAFVGVAIDDFPVPAREFAEEVGVVYPLGIDQDRTVGDSYPYIGLPTTYLIDEDGIVARQIQGQVLKEQLRAYLEFDLG